MEWWKILIYSLLGSTSGISTLALIAKYFFDYLKVKHIQEHETKRFKDKLQHDEKIAKIDLQRSIILKRKNLKGKRTK